MTRPKVNLTFLLDEGVPDSVARALRSAGHEATPLRESGVARGSPDQLVCTYAMVCESILVALDGDMKRIAQANGVSLSRFKRLNLLKLSCDEVSAASRVAEAMSLIEHEWDIPKEEGERKIYVEINRSNIKTNR